MYCDELDKAARDPKLKAYAKKDVIQLIHQIIKDNVLDRIQNRKRAQTKASRDRVDALQRELAALEAEQQRQAQNMQDSNRAMGRGGYQSSFGGDSDFMEGPSDPGCLLYTLTLPTSSRV